MIEAFNYADWAIIAVVVVSALISLWRGFVKEVLSVLVWVAAIVSAMVFREKFAVFLVDHIESESARLLVAAFVLFFVVLLTGTFITNVISKLLHVTGLSGTDRLLGCIFGAIRGVLFLLSAMLIGAKMLPIEQEQWYQQSQLIPHVLLLETWVIEVTEGLRDTFASLLETPVVEDITK